MWSVEEYGAWRDVERRGMERGQRCEGGVYACIQCVGARYQVAQPVTCTPEQGSLVGEEDRRTPGSKERVLEQHGLLVPMVE